jgi:hypothetical protein
MKTKIRTSLNQVWLNFECDFQRDFRGETVLFAYFLGAVNATAICCKRPLGLPICEVARIAGDGQARVSSNLPSK